jgi:hypothetical protein
MTPFSDGITKSGRELMDITGVQYVIRQKTDRRGMMKKYPVSYDKKLTGEE